MEKILSRVATILLFFFLLAIQKEEEERTPFLLEQPH